MVARLETRLKSVCGCLASGEEGMEGGIGEALSRRSCWVIKSSRVNEAVAESSFRLRARQCLYTSNPQAV